MARAATTFDAEDRATVRAWMTDAALNTAALAITANWRGVKSSLETLDVTNPVPPPGAPAAGAYYLLSYSQEPVSVLSGALGGGLPAVLDVWIVAQPQISGSDPEDFFDDLVAAVRSHVATKAAAANIPYKTGIPAVWTADLGTWRRKRVMMRLWT